LTATGAEIKQELSDYSGTTASEIFHEHISPDGFLFPHSASPSNNIFFESLGRFVMCRIGLKLSQAEEERRRAQAVPLQREDRIWQPAVESPRWKTKKENDRRAAKHNRCYGGNWSMVFKDRVGRSILLGSIFKELLQGLRPLIRAPVLTTV
jgi:hypothetical protein